MATAVEHPPVNAGQDEVEEDTESEDTQEGGDGDVALSLGDVDADSLDPEELIARGRAWRISPATSRRRHAF